MLTFVTDRRTDGRKIWEGEIADILTKMMMHTQTNKTYISIDVVSVISLKAFQSRDQGFIPKY